MACWMNHEIYRVEEMISYWVVEKDSELWIKVDLINPIEFIFKHRVLTSHRDLIPTLIAKK